MNKRKTLSWYVAGVLLAAAAAHAQGARISVAVDQPGPAIPRTLWGVFFEDINFGADGGLYAELVKNRAFEFPDSLMGWTETGSPGAHGTISIATNAPFNTANPHYLRVSPASKAAFGVANDGFRGIGVKSGEKYDCTMEVRAVTGAPALLIQLVEPGGKVLASKRMTRLSAQWTRQGLTLRPSATVEKARLTVLVENGGSVDMDMVSLFPRRTWKNRPGGLRADMVQWLAAMQPGFVRFPGGCIVEGITLTNRYQWKNTIGPVAERKLMLNRWNREFKHRPAPDYYQSFGLGFFEYFQLCEDIGAEPLPILNCGMACQFNSGELCPLDQIDPYIQDALDLIEFANGPATSVWGARRAEMGHAKPFHLKMIGIGNEQWDEQYIERYARFHAALKARYPGISLISSAGPSPDDQHFQFAWPRLRELHADIVDEHCYARPDWFFNNTHRYDNYDRKGPKVFFGEYAAQSDKTVSVQNRNNLECALAEAACMTGLERNADVVQMASYAPLFAHKEGWQWRPDLIWVDNLQSYGTPSYYVQKLFARNAGDVILPVSLEASGAGKLFASATRDETTRETILKVVNGENTPATASLDFTGPRRIGSKATVLTLTSQSLQDENSFTEPAKVSPRTSSLKVSGPRFDYTFPAASLTVIRLRTSQ